MTRTARILAKWTDDRSGTETEYHSSVDLHDVADPVEWFAAEARGILRVACAIPPRRGSLRISVSVDTGNNGEHLDALIADVPESGDVLLIDLPVPELPYDEEEAAAAERRRRRQAPSAPAPRRREDRDVG